MIIGAPTKIDVSMNGKKLRRGYQVWPIGVDIAKGELYGWLGLRRDAAGEAPAGYCHFPAHGDEFFQQITAENLVTIRGRKGGRVKMEWQVQPNRENHYLDCRIYARAAVALLGIDRMQPPAAATPATPKPATAAPMTPPPLAERPREGFWNKPGGGGKGWFGRRR
jgi:phage terminase large subunit GpA-like protein